MAPILLVLEGAQSAGGSTVGQELMSIAAKSWPEVFQTYSGVDPYLSLQEMLRCLCHRPHRIDISLEM
jgi:hypothetical protein